MTHVSVLFQCNFMNNRDIHFIWRMNHAIIWTIHNMFTIWIYAKTHSVEWSSLPSFLLHTCGLYLSRKYLSPLGQQRQQCIWVLLLLLPTPHLFRNNGIMSRLDIQLYGSRVGAAPLLPMLRGQFCQSRLQRTDSTQIDHDLQDWSSIVRLFCPQEALQTAL